MSGIDNNRTPARFAAGTVSSSDIRTSDVFAHRAMAAAEGTVVHTIQEEHCVEVGRSYHSIMCRANRVKPAPTNHELCFGRFGALANPGYLPQILGYDRRSTKRIYVDYSVSRHYATDQRRRRGRTTDGGVRWKGGAGD